MRRRSAIARRNSRIFSLAMRYSIVTTIGPLRDSIGNVGVGSFHWPGARFRLRSEEHTSELQSLMRTSYAVFCLKKKNNIELVSTGKVTKNTIAVDSRSRVTATHTTTFT